MLFCKNINLKLQAEKQNGGALFMNQADHVKFCISLGANIRDTKLCRKELT